MSHEWEQIAALTGGTVSDLAVTDSGSLLAATSGGLYQSADGGQSWAVMSGRHGPSMVEAVAPSPAIATDSTLFVGSSLGLHRSRDSGATWLPVLSNGHVRAVGVSPGFARDGLVIAGTDADGILRSEDAGEHWTGANAGLLDLSITALGISPDFERDQVCFAGTLSGLYRSRNGGKSWQATDSIPDESAIQCIALSPRFDRDRHVLCGTEMDGLWQSRDGGGSWDEVPALAGRSVLAIAFSPRFPMATTIAVATDDGVHVSTDGGASWRRCGEALGDVLSLAFVPVAHGEVLIAGRAREGISRSEDGGATWNTANQGLHARLLVGLTPSPRFPQDQTLLAADLQYGPLISTDAGVTWTTYSDGLDDASVSSIQVVSQGSGDHAWYTATGSGVFRRRREGTAWARLPGTEGFTTTGAFSVAPASGGRPAVVVALRGGKVLQLADEREWRPLGSPLSHTEIASLLLSPGYGQDRSILAVTSRAGVPTPELVLWHSANGGEDWRQWSEPVQQSVLPLVVAPAFPANGAVFVGMGNQVVRSVHTDNALPRGSAAPRWRGVELGSASTTITALALVPDDSTAGTIVAATSRGVFRSRNQGETFRQWTDGPGPTSVVALSVTPSPGHGHLVYAVEMGGGIWRRPL